MRIGGLVSDYLGEVRLAEPQVLEHDALGSSVILAWKGGRFALGYPFGMPLGVDAGVAFQVYSSGALVAAGTQPLATVRRPGGTGCFEVLAVAVRLAGIAQPNVLERGLGRRASLGWPASASTDVASYNVYSDNLTGAVDYGTPVAEIDAKPGGRARTNYSWTSDELDAGRRRFGIRAVDAAGNVQVSPALEVTVVISPAPDPPADLVCAYDPDTHAATLTWSAPARWD